MPKKKSFAANNANNSLATALASLREQDHSPRSAAMTIPHFMIFANISRGTVYREAREGRLILRKVGAKTVILRSDAEAWLNSLPVVAPQNVAA